MNKTHTEALLRLSGIVCAAGLINSPRCEDNQVCTHSPKLHFGSEWTDGRSKETRKRIQFSESEILKSVHFSENHPHQNIRLIHFYVDIWTHLDVDLQSCFCIPVSPFALKSLFCHVFFSSSSPKGNKVVSDSLSVSVLRLVLSQMTVSWLKYLNCLTSAWLNLNTVARHAVHALWEHLHKKWCSFTNLKQKENTNCG